MNTQERAYRQGRDAAARGFHYSLNPYPEASAKERLAWGRGHNEQRAGDLQRKHEEEAPVGKEKILKRHQMLLHACQLQSVVGVAVGQNEAHLTPRECREVGWTIDNLYDRIDALKQALEFYDLETQAAQHELDAATQNWPAFNSAHEGFAVLKEEIDELWDHVKTGQKKRDLEAMRREAIQAAAMCLRFARDVCNEEVGRK